MDDPAWGICVALARFKWGIYLALIQKKWGICVALDITVPLDFSMLEEDSRIWVKIDDYPEKWVATVLYPGEW